jgi:arabinofuranosyltransferase
MSQEKKFGKSFLVFPLAFFLFLIVKDGWLSDDSYITLRVVDNFLHGYGLTWNTDERVQTYTHPLWMFCISLVSFCTHEVYYSTLLLSIVLSLIGVTIFSVYLARSRLLATLGIMTLAASKSFIDFSTSGLENSLTYLLIVIFMLVFYREQRKEQYVFLLALIAGLATLNRMDTLLLFIPALIVVFCQFPGWKSVKALLLGFSPFLCWEVFSLCYYGFIFPNTAYAKLDTGIDSVQLFLQGIGYLVSSFAFDPLLFVVIAASIFFLVQQRVWKDLPFLIGMGLYLLYTVKIGGDFMAGRFLTEPFLIGVILLAHTSFPSSKSNYILAFAIILLFEIVTPNSRWYPLIHSYSLIDQRGVADERTYLVETTALVQVGPIPLWPKPLLLVKGLPGRLSGQHVVVRTTIGYFGFVAGPHVHIVDIWALGDPLLARLPAIPGWRIGHFERHIPAGYLETLASGKNVIHDQQLALYYGKLQEITRGPLFAAQRWIDIWELNV